MDDLIYRGKLLEYIDDNFYPTLKRAAIERHNMFIDAINNAPAVDAVPVRRGRWIPHITEDGYKSGYDCSVCGVWLVMPNGLRKYCCDCGALMDGGEKDG